MCALDRLLERTSSFDLNSLFPWMEIRAEIHFEYDYASPADRLTLLKIHASVMDAVERQLAPADLKTFRTARRLDYNLLLMSECVLGDGNVSFEALEVVTRREVKAGRMAPNDEMRRMALQGLSAVEQPPSLLQPVAFNRLVEAIRSQPDTQ
jgi:hypothetical protein